MPSLFRRKPAEPELIAEADPEPTLERSTRGYTPGKGRATPKRGQPQRRVPQPPPANRREAYRRMRDKQRVERTEKIAGMKAGDERYLLARDRGPEKALVRDIVDSRFNAGTIFLVGALVVVVFSMSVFPAYVRYGANMLWVFLALAVIVDSFVLTRKIRKLVRVRFPDTQQRLGSLYWYAIFRSVSFRRMRMPRPRVRVGEPI